MRIKSKGGNKQSPPHVEVKDLRRVPRNLQGMLVELFLGALLFILLFLWMNRDPAGLPPGPRCFPVIGSVSFPQNGKDSKALRDKYGDIVRCRIGQWETVTLCNYKTIREAFSKHEFSDRPKLAAFSFLADGESGILFSSGERWQHSRRFLLRHLRDMGMGKSYLCDAILIEAKDLVEDFHNYTDSPNSIPSSINVAILNVIWQLVANKRYNLHDEELLKFIALIKEFQSIDQFLLLPDVFPWLRYLPLWRRMFKYEWHETMAVKIRTIMKEIVDDHKAKLDPDNPKDVIDAYLVEMEAHKNSNDSLFSDSALLRDIFDLFFAGYDTTSNMTRCVILYMAAYPQVQKKVQEEIDEVVGRDTLPSHLHRPRLNYLEATLHEINRLKSPAPLGVPHATNSDIHLEGYLIRKGTIINGCIGAVHTDPQYWKEPELFLPDRFLDESGNLVVQKEGYFPFGVGKRSCLGEALARMELYLFAAALLQNFTFAPPEGSEIDLAFQNIPDFQFALDQNIIITARK